MYTERPAAIWASHVDSRPRLFPDVTLSPTVLYSKMAMEDILEARMLLRTMLTPAASTGSSPEAAVGAPEVGGAAEGDRVGGGVDIDDTGTGDGEELAETMGVTRAAKVVARDGGEEAVRFAARLEGDRVVFAAACPVLHTRFISIHPVLGNTDIRWGRPLIMRRGSTPDPPLPQSFTENLLS